LQPLANPHVPAPAHPISFSACGQAADLDLMKRIDRLCAEFSFAGSRVLRGLLAADGRRTGRRQVKTPMRRTRTDDTNVACLNRILATN
jgi:hypothetical protein